MLITKGLLVCLRDQISPELLTATAVVWEQLIGEIPTDALERVWRSAWEREGHTPGFPVTADELLAVWRTSHPAPPREAAPIPYLAKLEARERARANGEEL